MFESFKRWLTKARPAAGPNFVVGPPTELPVEKLLTYEAYLKAACSQIWAVWKACHMIANRVKTTPYKVVRQNTSTEVNNVDLAALLQAPNEFETLGDLLYKSVFHRLVCGRAHWLKTAADIARGRPSALYALNPKRMKPVQDKTNGRLLGYEYKVRGQSIPYDVEEIITFGNPHPNDDWNGMGNVEPGESMLEDAINRANYTERFWKAGATPSGILLWDDPNQPDAEDWKKIKKQWQEEYGGVKNAGKTAFLWGKFKYQQLGLTFADLQDVERQRLTTEQIFMLFGVPLSVAGIQAAANYATASIDAQAFSANTIYPEVKLFEETLNTDLVPLFDVKAVLKFQVQGLIDLAKVGTEYGPLFDRGVVTRNEVRQAAGLEKIEGDPTMDGYYMAGSYVPAELAGMTASTAVAEQQTGDTGAGGAGSRQQRPTPP